jgi:threonine aldolase
MQHRGTMLLAPFLMAVGNAKPILLQSPHASLSPAETFRQLADFCEANDVNEWDVYGDFSNPETYVRQFEQKVALELGKEDAVFMPSGVMAQSIALLIHSQQKPKRFACHASSHLLIHESDAYRELLNLEAISLETMAAKNSIAPAPLDFATVETQLTDKAISTLILEIPHRELGGKATSWRDVERMRDFCRTNQIAFHCDGARLFEASVAFPGKSVADLAKPFDSVYLSFYKGLAGLSGAMLLGSSDFCQEARIWLRRFGGNLYTLLPYVVSAHAGYQKYWLRENGALSFLDKKEKLCNLVQLLKDHPIVLQVVRFEPEEPQVNMVHGYLFDSVEECQMALDHAAAKVGIRALHRIRNAAVNPFPVDIKYQSMFEWSMGEANAQIEDEDFVRAWEAFASQLLELRQSG